MPAITPRPLGSPLLLAALSLALGSACLDSREPGAVLDTRQEAGDSAPAEIESPVEVDASVDVGLDSAVSDARPDADGTAEKPDATRPDGAQPDGADDASGPRPCPVARIEVTPGTRVAPMTTLTLDGSASRAVDGAVLSFQWEVDRPRGSAGVFRPSPYVASPSFDVDLAGHYTFRLVVFDERGTRSCAPATATVAVIPESGLFVELVWEDRPTESERRGADLDLHILHPLADSGHDGDGDGVMDGWFDSGFDAFWHNPRPSWGSFDPDADDDPALLLDSGDGSTGELVALMNPEPGLSYTVGVHVWDGRAVREAVATARVYLAGRLAFELGGVSLQHRDLWSVAKVRWSDPPVVELLRRCEGTTMSCRADSECGGVPCGLRIVGDYTHPHFPLVP